MDKLRHDPARPRSPHDRGSDTPTAPAIKHKGNLSLSTTRHPSHSRCATNKQLGRDTLLGFPPGNLGTGDGSDPTTGGSDLPPAGSHRDHSRDNSRFANDEQQCAPMPSAIERAASQLANRVS